MIVAMIIFIDTEFTDLQEPYLISAGLAAEDGAELYVELEGTNPAACSPFVVQNVLPQLAGEFLRPVEVAKRIADFVAFRGAGPIILFSEDPRYDIELLRPFISPRLHCKVAVPTFESAESETRYSERKQAAYTQGLRRHHALDDARAIRQAWLSLGNP